MAMFGLIMGMDVVPHALRDMLVIALVAGALAALELHRRREFLLLANLGTAPTTIVVNGLIIAFTLEVLLLGVVTVLR